MKIAFALVLSMAWVQSNAFVAPQGAPTTSYDHCAVCLRDWQRHHRKSPRLEIRANSAAGGDDMPASRLRPKITIPSADDILAAAKTRAAAAAHHKRMAQLIGKPFPPDWSEGAHFVTGAKDAVWTYNEMAIVRGKFARISCAAPCDAGMLMIETAHGVSDALGSSQTRTLGPAILGKITGGSLDEACAHYKIE